MTRFARGKGALLGLCVGLVLALGPAAAIATAQTEDPDARAASARSLFDEGVELADQSRWADAADRFGRALALRDSAVIAYNLASALTKLGKLVGASELLRRISGNPETDTELRKSAETALAEITPQIGRVTIHAQGRQQGDLIAIDQYPLYDAQMDVPVPIDPGTHLLSAQRGSETLESRTLEIAQGSTFEVTLQLARAPAPRQVAAASAVATPDDTATAQKPVKPMTTEWWFWAGVGTAAVGVVVVAALVASAGGSSKVSPARGDFDPPVLHVVVAR